VTDGRVVVVTGASRGIGAAAASWFVAAGDRVVAVSRSGECDVAGIVGSYACDVADPDKVEATFDAIESSHGGCEVLVANAGVTNDQLAVRMGDDAWQGVLDVNLTGAFLCARRALRRMIRARAGRILFVSSVGAFVGLPGQANYAASKAGLVGLARALAREVGSRSITVNVVAPGLVDTDMTAALGPDRLELLAAQVPLGRVAAPSDVAGVIGFLASPSASYVTGAVVPVDGGLSMGT
jgi:3-oxoacyl-[acyl-carrier protein] reductase